MHFVTGCLSFLSEGDNNSRSLRYIQFPPVIFIALYTIHPYLQENKREQYVNKGSHGKKRILITFVFQQPRQLISIEHDLVFIYLIHYKSGLIKYTNMLPVHLTIPVKERIKKHRRFAIMNRVSYTAGLKQSDSLCLLI